MKKTIRPIQSITPSMATVEGAGLPVNRAFPHSALPDHDPFLLLDHFGPVTWGPNEANGVPDHPHRGFEAVTYLLDGQMEHKDSNGGGAIIGPGDVQWMTAGSGIVHSEMPAAEFRQQGGVLQGFQLWVNLPAKLKMTPPRYQDIKAENIPLGRSDDGRVTARVIAGAALGAKAVIDTHTPIGYVHFSLAPGGLIHHPVDAEQHSLAYVFKGTISTGEGRESVRAGQVVRFGDGDLVRLHNPADNNAELILLSGTPIKEPVARYGPFVMNTHQEIRQAVTDYNAGRMGQIAKGQVTA